MPEELVSIWDAVQNWVNHSAQQYVSLAIPRERTDLSGPDEPLKPQRDYLRLWLADMFLARDRQWFVNRYPAVHTAVELRFGANPVRISHVTDGSGQVGRGSFGSYALTDLVPFNGGTVKLQSALIALQGRNYLTDTIGILKDFSGLVGAPLGQTIAIADKVTSGIQKVFQSGGGEVSLGFHREYAADGGGGAVLKPGYVATILAGQRDLDSNRLWVQNSRLHYAAKEGAAPEPLEGYDYILLRIEGRRERDNWRMANIEEPLNQAIAATIEGDQEKAQGCLKAALLVIWQSPDLAVQDRRRVADAIKAELADVAGQPRGAAPKGPRSLEEIVATRAMPTGKALHSPELTLEEILNL